MISQSTSIARRVPQSLQPPGKLMLADIGQCRKSPECAKSYERRSACFYSQNGGDASIRLLTQQLQSRD
jgi:hypothetical protein